MAPRSGKGEKGGEDGRTFKGSGKGSKAEARGRGGGGKGDSGHWDYGGDEDRNSRNQAKGSSKRGGKGDSRQDTGGDDWDWNPRDRNYGGGGGGDRRDDPSEWDTVEPRRPPWRSGGGDRASREGHGDSGHGSDTPQRNQMSSDAPDFVPSTSHAQGGDDGTNNTWSWQPPPPRIPLWREFRDPETDLLYYYNAKTGLTQWEKPPELEPPKPIVPESNEKSKENLSGNRRDYGARDGDRDDDRRGGGGRDNTRDRDQNRDRDRDSGGRGDRYGGNDRGGGSKGGGGKGKKHGKRDNNAGQDPADFGPPGCNLFVFHLPDDWMDDDLNEYFCPHGNVVSAKVMKELGTGRSRGFGFVSYEDRVSAATAIKKMQGYKILGKRLKVEFKKGECEGGLLDDVGGDRREDDDSISKKNPADDERLIGYLRAISAKNVVQSLKESENEANRSAPLGEDHDSLGSYVDKYCLRTDPDAD